MPPTSAPAKGATRAVNKSKSRTRRPVYQVTLQRTREPKRSKRQFSELSQKLRIAVMLFVSGCLAWAVIVGTGFLIFIVLFAKAVSTILPVILARFP